MNSDEEENQMNENRTEEEHVTAATQQQHVAAENETAVLQHREEENERSGVEEEEEDEEDEQFESSLSPAGQVQLREPYAMRERKLKLNYKTGLQWNNNNSTTPIDTAFRISIKQALEGDHAEKATLAIKDEINNMLNYKVGYYIKYENIPMEHRQNIIPSFMFIVHKYKPNGTYDKTKARMVGDGSKQNGFMYDMISSTTVSLTSVLLLLNIATLLKAKVVSYDVKGAFLNASFTPEDVPTYMRIRSDVAKLWTEIDPSADDYLNDRGELLMQLDKFIYGLRQSPLKFQQHLKTTLRDIGYKECLNDDCVMLKTEGKDISLLSIHVDDILQVSTSPHLTSSLRAALVKTYVHITYHDEVEGYLG
eukprot:gene12888-14853_t